MMKSIRRLGATLMFFVSATVCFGTSIEAQGSVDDRMAVQDRSDGSHRALYQEQPWYDVLQDTFEGENLKRCFKRQFPPTEGAVCAKTPKTCFFGSQDCGAAGSSPEVGCHCNGTFTDKGRWSCVAVICPGSNPPFAEEDDIELVLLPEPNLTTQLSNLTASTAANESATLIPFEEPDEPAISVPDPFGNNNAAYTVVLEDPTNVELLVPPDEFAPNSPDAIQVALGEEQLAAAMKKRTDDMATGNIQSVRKLHSFRAKIYKVLRCRNFLCFSTRLTKADFGFWSGAGVSKGNQKDTYIGTLREPPVAKVRRLVLTLNGQNGFFNIVGNGSGSWVAGCPFGWHKGWKRNRASEDHQIPHGSFPHDFYERFNTGDTFIATAFATAFAFESSIRTKNGIEIAFYNWLRSKVSAGNLEEVVLAGFSRGGCLALRLAARFNRDFPNIDVAVMSADPVCRVSQREFGATSSAVQNPFVSSWKGPSTDMRVQFQNEGRNLFVQNFVSGHRNFVLDNIRGLSDKRATVSPFVMGGWYHQDWITARHGGADNWAAFMHSPNAFYDEARAWFDGECQNICPHGGSYDGAHCYFGQPPLGTSAFLWAGNFYHTPVPDVVASGRAQCPMPGSHFDTRNCNVQDAPDYLDPFIWQNGWYYQPTWQHDRCRAEWSKWYNEDGPSNTGDYELLANLEDPPCSSSVPADIECRATNPWKVAWQTGEVIHCSLEEGFYCVNEEQPNWPACGNNCCSDYTVRYLCLLPVSGTVTEDVQNGPTNAPTF